MYKLQTQGKLKLVCAGFLQVHEKSAFLCAFARNRAAALLLANSFYHCNKRKLSIHLSLQEEKFAKFNGSIWSYG